MVSAIDSALSGIAAASKKLEVSANNIANQFSTKSIKDGKTVDQPFVPQRVDQVSLSQGGVEAKVSNVTPATVPTAQGATPNVDTAQELVQQSIAAYDFKANLKTIKVQQNIDKALLNIET